MTAAYSMRDVIEIIVAARMKASAQERPLVDALSGFVPLLAPYVLARISAPEMIEAFDAAVAALSRVAGHKPPRTAA